MCTNNLCYSRYATMWKIYYFKLDGYHKVNCISKKLGYRNTEALGDDDLSQVHFPMEVRLRWRGVEPPRHSNSTDVLTLFSVSFTREGLAHSTMRSTWRRWPNRYTKVGELHNELEPPNNVPEHPRTSWGSETHKGLQGLQPTQEAIHKDYNLLKLHFHA